MTNNSTEPVRAESRQAAIEWYSRMTSDAVTAADRSAFTRWRNAAAEHEHAYQQVMAALSVADAALSDARAPAELFAAAASTVRDPLADATPVAARKVRTPRVVAFAAVAAGVVGLTLAWLSAAAIRSSEYTEIATATGQQYLLQLPDGSRVKVNTQTHVSYAVDSARRSLRLDSGEAYFEIAPDPARPFVISVGDREVRVVGTAFNIRHVDSRTDVAVTEGVVTLSEQTGPLSSLFPPDSVRQLTVGMMASYTPRSEMVLSTNISTAGVASWRDGRLIYRRERLADVLADLDRYFAQSLIVRDPLAANLRVSAVINLADEQTVLDALSRQLPITLHRRDDDVIEVTMTR